MEGGLEELRILQTIILLITTSNIVHGESLGKVSNFYTCIIQFTLLIAKEIQYHGNKSYNNNNNNYLIDHSMLGGFQGQRNK